MSKLVIELQKDCVSQTTSYETLFQKAYYIAQKLNQQGMIDFLRNEIDGYKKQCDVPQFRYVDVVYKAKNHMLGSWIPVSIPSNNPLTKYLRYPAFQSVSEMETFLASKGETLVLSISSELQEAFIEMSVNKIPLEIAAHFSKNQFKKILETEKRMICDWAIELERRGIMGEEYEFTTEEKEKAGRMTVININGSVSGANIIGSMNNSSATVNNGNMNFEQIANIISQIEKHLSSAGLEQNVQDEIKSCVSDIRDKIEAKDALGVKTILKKIYGFCQNVAGNIVASGIVSLIAPFLD